jgi:hypothetical protein
MVFNDHCRYRMLIPNDETRRGFYIPIKILVFVPFSLMRYKSYKIPNLNVPHAMIRVPYSLFLKKEVKYIYLT